MVIFLILVSMNFIIRKEENYSCIKVVRDHLDSFVSPDLKAELVMLSNNGERNIILDLSNVKYSDSSGLSSLLVGHRICKNSDGTFILTGINENIARLISISQLENILNIVGSVDEAIDLIFMEEIEKELKREFK